jgi:uncharacterized protein YjdB
MRLAWLLSLVSVALGACEGNSTSTSVPDRLVVISGDGQRGPVASQLADFIALRVEDAGGRARNGQVVDFRLHSGGQMQPARGVTTRGGLLQARWTLGDTAGAQQALAVLMDANGVTLDSVVLRATALAGPPSALSIIAGDQQKGTVGLVLPQPVTVRVVDSRGNPVAGTIVEFAVMIGAGRVPQVTAKTDSAGIARMVWELGRTAGSQAVRVSVAEVPPVTFTATAAGGAAVAVTVTPDTVTVRTGETVPLSAIVRDAFRNASGDPLIWLSTNPQVATVSPSGVVSGAAAGTAGIVAMASGVADTAVVKVVAGPPASMAIASGDGETVQVSRAIVAMVTVRDAWDQPVPEVTVHFTVGAGGGSVTPPTSLTRTDGTAMVAWTMGAAAGINTLTASVDGLPPVTFTAMATLTAPLTIQWWGSNPTETNSGWVYVGVRFNRPVGFPGVWGGAFAFVSVPGVSNPTVTLSPNWGGWPRGPECGLLSSPLCYGAILQLICVPTGSYELNAAGTAADGVRAEIKRAINITAPTFSAITVGLTYPWVFEGGTTQANATVNNFYACPNFTWSSSNSSVATVSSSGLVTGLSPGSATITATASGISASATVDVRAGSAVPASITIVAGDNQVGPVGKALPILPSVIVRNAAGQPLPGVKVRFWPTFGSGSVIEPDRVTGMDGIAVAGWWVPGPGNNTLTATVQGLPPVVFHATGT